MKESYAIRDLREEDRPYERCLRNGPEVLSDTELLAVILRTGVKGVSSLKLADQILSLSSCGQGLTGLYHLTADELQQLRGVGQVKAVQILCIGELSRRMARASRSGGIFFKTSEEVAAYYMESLRHKEQECVMCLMLDTRCRFLGEEEVSKGTVNASVVSAREVYITALRHRAVHLILIHNHPSGDPSPSEEDRLITRELVWCGTLLHIPLLDHIIVGDRCYISLRETDPDLFGQKAAGGPDIE